MNCSKCGAPLKPGAKFCVKCGTKVSGNIPEATQPQNQPTDIQQGNKNEKENLKEDLIVTNQRIHWNITPGQVARVITEQEMATYKDVEGIIIAEGTTAFIRANGTTIASISGGSYDFQPRRTSVGETVSTCISNAWQIKQTRGRIKGRNARQTAKRYFCTSKSRSVILDCNTAGQGILDACRSQAKESG